jgi:hypothetical protein
MDIVGDRRENGFKISNSKFLSITGSGSTTVTGSIQSDLVTGNEKFDFYKIIFVPQIHQMNGIVCDGEMHIIFKDKNSDKYQVNCILFNQNSNSSSELIAQKLVDEYFINNIPNSSKGQKLIKKSSLKWYLSDLVPTNQSYYSYILPLNNNVLMVLYEEPIVLSKEFITKLKENVYNNISYTFTYDSLNENSALFYTYDSLTSKDKRDKNVKKICNSDDISEKFNSDNNKNDDNIEIIYNNTKTSSDLQNIISDIEKDTEIKEQLNSEMISEEDIVNYNSETNIDNCSNKSSKKIIFGIIMFILFILSLIIVGLITFSKFKDSKKFVENEGSPPLLNKEKFMKLYKNFVFTIVENKNGNILTLSVFGIIIITTIIIGSIYAFSNYSNILWLIFTIIFMILSSLVIIFMIVSKFAKFNLKYTIFKDGDDPSEDLSFKVDKLISNTTQSGGQDVSSGNSSSSGNSNKYQNIFLSSIGNYYNNNNVLISWIKGISENTIKNFFEELYQENKEKIEPIETNIIEIKKMHSDIETWNKNDLKNDPVTQPDLPDNDIFKFKGPIKKYLETQYLNQELIDKYLKEENWSAIYNSGEYFKEKDTIKQKIEQIIKTDNEESNVESDIYKEIKKKHDEALKKIGTLKTPEVEIGEKPPTPPTQQGGNTKYHFYEPKKTRNDRLVKKILKNLK